MSDSSDEKQLSEANPLRPLLGRFEIPVLAVLVGFMFWVRTQSLDRFVRDGEVFFRGNDPWYHYRETTYTVENWPATMAFDPWTYFPYGTAVGQFGTLFDQLVATAAIVIGLGDPSPELIAMTLAVAPAVFGALVAIPAYFIGARLGGRLGGLFGVLVLALLPGTFLQYTLAGFGDHHAAEVFFQALAVLTVMVALAAAEREKPVYELVSDRDIEALRRPVGWSALAGVAIALYVWTWPPAILLIAILGIFFVVKLCASYLNGQSPEPIAFVGTVAMGVAGILTLSSLSAIAFSPNLFGLLQPLSALAIAVVCVALAWLAREWDDRGYDRRAYPASVFGILFVGVGLTALLLPDLFNTLQNNFQRFVGFSAGAQTRTIGEAQPFLSQTVPQFGIGAGEVILREYGAMFYTALLGLAFLIARPILRSGETRDLATFAGGAAAIGIIWMFGIGGVLASVLPLDIAPVMYDTMAVGGVIALLLLAGDHDAEEMFVVVWALFIIAAAFTQVRFNYYLAVVVVALNAYLIGQLMLFLQIARPDGRIQTEIEPYQIMALMLALLVIFPGLVVPIELGHASQQVTTDTAWDVGNATGPGDVTQWDGTLQWMQGNTPEVGTYGGADNPMKLYGTYDHPPDGDFEYPEGAYGVMSWWDYGHWITVRGERIPTANPFQQGATDAANFLLAPDEAASEAVLAELSDDGAETRYVVIDWKMVNADAQQHAKFTAPVVFYDAEEVTREDFLGDLVYQEAPQGGMFGVMQPKEQRYYESMMVRLYEYHGSAAEPEPVVIDWDVTQAQDHTGEMIAVRSVPEDGELVKRFDTMAEAEAYVANTTNAQIGGYGVIPQERVPALEHYRLVKVSESSAFNSQAYYNSVLRQIQSMGQNVTDTDFFNHPQWVKVFERVDGAEVSGQGPPDTTVQASVQMRMLTTNETFLYEQQVETGPDGSFTMTLPYSTVGYDEWGPEQGYTNVSVQAEGPYVFSTPFEANETEIWNYHATANVSEAQVIGEDDSTVEIELERQNPFDFDDEEGADESDVPADESGDEESAAPGNETDANDTGDESLFSSGPFASTTADADLRDGDSTGMPGGTETRAGLVALVFAGLFLDVRND